MSTQCSVSVHLRGRGIFTLIPRSKLGKMAESSSIIYILDAMTNNFPIFRKRVFSNNLSTIHGTWDPIKTLPSKSSVFQNAGVVRRESK